MTPKKSALLLSAATLGLFLTNSFPVYADTVLTFERETSGSLRPARQRPGGNDTPPPAAPDVAPKQNVVVSLKGVNARVEFRPSGAKPETAPTTVLIYDGKAQKIYTLNMTAKTYFAQTYKEVIDGEPRPSNGNDSGFASRMTFNGSVDLTAARASNAFVTKDIAGIKSKQYILAGNVAMQFNMPPGETAGGPPSGPPPAGAGQDTNGQTADANGGAAAGGGRFGGGRRGQGGFGGPGGGPGGFTPPSIDITGDIWTTDGTALFTEGRETPIAAVYRLMLPDNAGPFGGPITKPLITRLKNMKALPGESTMAFHMKTNFPNPQGNAAPADSGLTTHLTIQAIQSDATIDDALFTLPTDFKEAEPPAPNFGGRGQGGRPRGNRGNE